MTSNYDIQMSTDDTIELDAIIKKWSDKNSIVNLKNKTQKEDEVFSGFQTKTMVFNPDEVRGIYYCD
jgi:hypothetical protein